MGFELSIAVKRDRLEGQDTGDPVALAPYATITLNGLLEPPASREVLRTVAALFGEGADSVLIEMDDVRADNRVYLQNFAAELMSLRGAGRHVQVAQENRACMQRWLRWRTRATGCSRLRPRR